VSYSELKKIREDASKQWPGDYIKQIEAIRQYCESFSSRSRNPPNLACTSRVELVKEQFLELNSQERDHFLEWLWLQAVAARG